MNKQEQIDALNEELAEVEDQIASHNADIDTFKTDARRAREKYQDELEGEDIMTDAYYQEIEQYEFWLDEAEGCKMSDEQRRIEILNELKQLKEG